MRIFLPPLLGALTAIALLTLVMWVDGSTDTPGYVMWAVGFIMGNLLGSLVRGRHT